MPRAEDVLAICEQLNGLQESPPGSNHNYITEWYGFSGAWCAMSTSYELYFGGFNDGQGNIAVPGHQFDSGHGDAYCPDAVIHYTEAGMFDMSPRVGDAVLFHWSGGEADHIGRLASILDDGTLMVWEGNHHDQFEMVHRDWTYVLGFGHEPYDDVAPTVPSIPSAPEAPHVPAFPGRFLQLTSPWMTGEDIRVWQEQMHTRGWTIDVDGEYGPQSRGVCVRFEKNKDLTVDSGIVGPQVWTCAFTCPVT